MITDEKFVSRVRRQLELQDKYSITTRALRTIVILLLIGFMGWIVHIAFGAFRDGGVPSSADFLIGLTFGSMIGMIVFNFFDSLLLMTKDGPARSQRLMLRYHDELAALKGDSPHS